MLTNGSSLKTHIPTLLSLWRKSKSKNPLSSKELSDVSTHLLQLQRGLTGDRLLVGSGYMENTAQLGAYLLYYWPVTYTQVYWITKNCSYFNTPTKKEIKILDLGSGPAPASVSLCDELQKKGTDRISVTLVDSSAKALSLAKQIYEKDFKSVTIETRVQNFEKDLSQFDTNFDIIIMSHALNELWKNQNNIIEKRTDFLAKVSQRLHDDGIIILSEPALLETSRNLIKIRDSLIQKGYRILSPCICTHNCPALSAGDNHTCHADIQWNAIEPVASIAQKAKLDRESVKMTYFVLQKPSESVPIENQSVTQNDKSVTIHGKVVSDGMLNKSGRIRFLVCDGKSRLTVSAKKDDSHAKNIGFFNLKRYDSVTICTPEIRGDKDNPAYGIKEDTDLRVQKYS